MSCWYFLIVIVNLNRQIPCINGSALTIYIEYICFDSLGGYILHKWNKLKDPFLQ